LPAISTNACPRSTTCPAAQSTRLAEESRFARQLGFSGKTCIHPNQTPVVNAAFSPAPEEVEQARRLVAAFDEQLAAGAGAFTFDGKMVDMPMLVAARKVLARAGTA
jgi:citrate lyase beta subunit